VDGSKPFPSELMRTAQAIQQRIVLAQRELAETEVNGSAGGGLVTVTMRGDGEIVRVAITQTAIDEGDAGTLSRLTFDAIRHAIEAIKTITNQKMAAAAAQLEASSRIAE
jgi:nucleoid-associated protein EbfC